MFDISFSQDRLQERDVITSDRDIYNSTYVAASLPDLDSECFLLTVF